MLLLLNPAEPALALNKTAGAARAETRELWLSVSWLITILGPTHWLPEFFQLFSGSSSKYHVSSVLINNFTGNLITEAINSHCRKLGEYKQKKKKVTDNCHSVIATVHILSKSLSGLLNIYIIMHTF